MTNSIAMRCITSLAANLIESPNPMTSTDYTICYLVKVCKITKSGECDNSASMRKVTEFKKNNKLDVARFDHFFLK